MQLTKGLALERRALRPGMYHVINHNYIHEIGLFPSRLDCIPVHTITDLMFRDHHTMQFSSTRAQVRSLQLWQASKYLDFGPSWAGWRGEARVASKVDRGALNGLGVIRDRTSNVGPRYRQLRAR